MAALRPGAPVMEPPGCVVAPVWYRPAIGMRWDAPAGHRAQPAGLRDATVAAVERAVHHVRVRLLVVGRRLDEPGQYHVVGEAGREPLQVRELALGVFGLDGFPVGIRWAVVDLLAEQLDRVHARRRAGGSARVGVATSSHGTSVDKPARPQVLRRAG